MQKRVKKSNNLLNEVAPTLISLELLTPRGFSQVRTMLLALTITAVRYRAGWLSASDRKKKTTTTTSLVFSTTIFVHGVT